MCENCKTLTNEELRAQARERGDKTYSRNKPCKRCGDNVYFAKGGGKECVTCRKVTRHVHDAKRLRGATVTRADALVAVKSHAKDMADFEKDKVLWQKALSLGLPNYTQTSPCKKCGTREVRTSAKGDQCVQCDVNRQRNRREKIAPGTFSRGAIRKENGRRARKAALRGERDCFGVHRAQRSYHGHARAPPQKSQGEDRTRMDRVSHNIIQGDALEVMRRFPSKSFQVIVTSPPYNINMKYGAGTNDKMDPEKYTAWQRECVTEMLRLLADGGCSSTTINTSTATGGSIAPQMRYWKASPSGKR